MSMESMEWLQRYILFGFTEKRNHKSWHNNPELRAELGIENNHYPGAIPVDDVIRRLFNWTADESIMGWQVPNVNGTDLIWITDDRFKVLYRSDNHHYLGKHGEGYQGHSYKEWGLEAFSHIIDANLAIGSAGLLQDGAQAFVQIEMPEGITIKNGGPTFRPYLGFCTSFNGTLSSTYKTGVTIWECDNTLAAGLKEAGNKYKVKHTRNSSMRLQDAKEALEIVHTIAGEFEQEFETLSNTTVSDEEWGKFVDRWAPMPTEQGKGMTQAENKQAAISQLWNADERVTPWKNTAFGVVQAVNTYTHHVATVRGGAESDNDKLALRTMRNTEKMINGTYDKLDKDIYALLSSVLPKTTKVAVPA